MVGAQQDASSGSTAASEQSDKRKRSALSDDETSFKPYVCRFCPMKFAKSQALGGHMNRHRQEREQEQLRNARQLLMQQEFSSGLMPGKSSPSALPRLAQPDLHRSASNDTLHNTIGPSTGASVYRAAGLQANPFNPSLGSPSLSWNNLDGANGNQSLVTPFGLDSLVSSYQARQACGLQLDNRSTYNLEQPLSMFPYVSNTHRNNSLPSQQQVLDQSSLLSRPTFMSASNRGLIRHRSNDLKNPYPFSQASSLRPQAASLQMTPFSSGFQQSSTVMDGSAPRQSLSSSMNLNFNVGSTSQLDTLAWLHGNARTAPDLGTQLPPKNMRWDLSFPGTQNEDKDLGPLVMPPSALQFEADYAEDTSEVDGTQSQSLG